MVTFEDTYDSNFKSLILFFVFLFIHPKLWVYIYEYLKKIYFAKKKNYLIDILFLNLILK
jgi:hypothetical protein